MVDRAARTIILQTATERVSKKSHHHEKKNSVHKMPLNGRLTQMVPEEIDEMLECETGSLLDRVASLEKKSLDQRDEIVSIRATLADALRRIAHLEEREKREEERNDRIVSSPLRDRHIPSKSNHTAAQKEKRLRQTGSPCLRNSTSGSTQVVRDSVSSPRRPVSYGHSPQFPQMRSARSQSTVSLHSDSPSSNGASPVPSPSPKSMLLPVASRSPTTRVNMLLQSSLRTAKRWSSTGDFSNSNEDQEIAAYCFPSREYIEYNEEEGTVTMDFESFPVSFSIPTTIRYYPNAVNVLPERKLKLDWVYGYRGKDCRSNLHFLPTGEIVYFVATVVVLYNVEEHSQRHFRGHTADVKCIAIHPNKLIVATGQGYDWVQQYQTPHIVIWNSVSLSEIRRINIPCHNTAICCLSFSKADGGIHLCAIYNMYRDHESNVLNQHISIWDWQKGDNSTKVTETKCSADMVVCAEWHPLEYNQIVSCGKEHTSFWTLDDDGKLHKRMGVFLNRDKPKYVTCIAFNQSGDVLTGDSNGNVIIWGRGTNTALRILKTAHEGSIFSLCVLKDGLIITGGGKDGKILYFDESLKPTGDEAQIEDHFGGIRTVAEGRGSQLLIGTTRNCILVGDVRLGFYPAMLGHTEEVWGLAAHPSLPQFATAGHDRLLQMWDSLSHTVVWSKDIGEQVQSIGFSPAGNVLVVGCTTGKWLVIDSETRELLYTDHTDKAKPITVVQFSPDGSRLVLGSADSCIYMYEVNAESTKYSRVCQSSRLSMPITHIDWSEDGEYIRINNIDGIFYLAAKYCRIMANGDFYRNMKWATHTCVISFETIGIWPVSPDGSEINACSRSADSKLLAAACSNGLVKLVAYPAYQSDCMCFDYDGHSGSVTNVSFLQDSTRLISIGRSDTSVLQWTVVRAY